MSQNLKEQSINSFIWKSAQSLCTLGMTFVIQLILARILLPEDFGIVAITTVFMTLANTIIETSFSSAVIQRNTLDQKLISSIFYANLVLSVFVYFVLFFTAPVISVFYQEPILVTIIRIQGLKVIFSGIYSIPQAFLNRKMKFKTLFVCSFIGTIGQAVIGISMAMSGAGIWALVISTLASSIIAGGAIIIMEPWRPSLFFSFKMVKKALSFSSKVLIIRVLRKLFYNVRVLAIGKVYDTQILGFFNKGFQFPSTAMTVVDGSLTSVAFSSLSKLQNNTSKLLASLRQYVRISMFICTPLMIGMALVAEPMVLVLLTDKWEGCIPYLQIICITQLFLPLNVKTTAFEALGESGISMKLHVSGILLSIIFLLLCIPFSPLVMTLSGCVSNLVLHIAVAVVSFKKLNYKMSDQIKDALCGGIPTLFMILVLILLNYLNCHILLKLCIQIFSGVMVYVIISYITKNQVFYTIYGIIKSKLFKRKNENCKTN